MKSISILDFQFAKELMEDLEAAHEKEKWMDNSHYAGFVNLYIRTKAYYFVGLGDHLPKVFDLIKSQVDTGDLETRWDSIDISYNNYEANLNRSGIGSRGKLISKEEALEVIRLFRYTALNKLAVAPYLFGAASSAR